MTVTFGMPAHDDNSACELCGRQPIVFLNGHRFCMNCLDRGFTHVCREEAEEAGADPDLVERLFRKAAEKLSGEKTTEQHS